MTIVCGPSIQCCAFDAIVYFQPTRHNSIEIWLRIKSIRRECEMRYGVNKLHTDHISTKITEIPESPYIICGNVNVTVCKILQFSRRNKATKSSRDHYGISRTSWYCIIHGYACNNLFHAISHVKLFRIFLKTLLVASRKHRILCQAIFVLK